MLAVKLKPGERLVVNGAVLHNGNARNVLYFANRASILRERDVMQLALLRRRGHAADERDAMVIWIAAHEHHAARHHVLGIDVGDLESQHLRVELRGLAQVARPQDDVTELADPKRSIGGRPQSPQLSRIKRHRTCLPTSGYLFAAHCLRSEIGWTCDSSRTVGGSARPYPAV